MFNRNKSSNHIVLTEAEFKKTAKRLHGALQDKSVSELLKLTSVYEELSKALGFRNYDALNKFFNKIPSTSKQPFLIYYKRHYFLQSMQEDEIINLFSFLISSQNVEYNEVWYHRGMSLISSVIPALLYMYEEKEILLSAQLINEYLIFENIYKLLYRRKDFPNDIHNKLKKYLISIPKFQDNYLKQSQTTYEMHSYLQMQFTRPLKLIKLLEEKDPLVFHISWLNVVYHEDGNLKRQALNENLLADISNEYSPMDWHHIFEDKKHYSNKYDSYQLQIEKIEINQKIKSIVTYSNNWINDERFEDIVLDLLKNKQLRNLYLSDILFYLCKTKDITERQKNFKYFEFLMNDYDKIIQINKEIH